MLNEKTILFVGGDKRQLYLRDFLVPYCKEVLTYDLDEETTPNLQKAIAQSHILILPMPFAKERVKLNCKTKTIFIKDFFKLELQDKLILLGSENEFVKDLRAAGAINYTDYYNSALAYLNAIPTAEGAIELLINKRETTLFESTVLITGFGRVSQVLANRLHNLGANVTVAARRQEVLAQAVTMGYKVRAVDSLERKHIEYDIVINTPNAPIFSKSMVEKFPQSTLFLELASLPGGFDFDYKNFKNIIYAPSLPGKVAPKTAGEYVGKTILKLLNEGD